MMRERNDVQYADRDPDPRIVVFISLWCRGGTLGY